MYSKIAGSVLNYYINCYTTAYKNKLLIEFSFLSRMISIEYLSSWLLPYGIPLLRQRFAIGREWTHRFIWTNQVLSLVAHLSYTRLLPRRHLASNTQTVLWPPDITWSALTLSLSCCLPAHSFLARTSNMPTEEKKVCCPSQSPPSLTRISHYLYIILYFMPVCLCLCCAPPCRVYNYLYLC